MPATTPIVEDQQPTRSHWLADMSRAGYITLLEELIAGSETNLDAALHRVVTTIEEQCPGVIGSILLLDQETKQLRHGAGAKLPKSYREAIDGLTIGPDVGSCGSAAFTASRVIAADIATDPKWALFKELAKDARLAACWSQPIITTDNTVLGTFAMYYAEPREPGEEDLLVIDAAAHLAKVAIDRDIARRVDAAHRSLEIKLLEGQKNESLAILAGGVAHDFNNLLVSILGNADLLLIQKKPNSADVPYLRSIKTASRRAAELANQLLAYSGRGKSQVNRLDLAVVVREMAQLLDVQISVNSELVLDLDNGSAFVNADATQIRQLVMNLIINASEALEGDRGLVEVRVRVLETDSGESDDFATNFLGGDCVLLEVSDTGIGMDSATQSKVFDPFFTTKFTGRGLGMAAAQGIVRGHGGMINVESELGKGSIFKIRLPLVSPLPA
jgi:two-component system cell cycle sensor histidine kinase/response regulator CckA